MTMLADRNTYFRVSAQSSGSFVHIYLSVRLPPHGLRTVILEWDNTSLSRV